MVEPRTLTWAEIEGEGVTYSCSNCSWTTLTRSQHIGKATDLFDKHACEEHSRRQARVAFTASMK